ASSGSLAPGARLLLYTDGLIEDRRRDIAEGFSALARVMRRSPAQTAERTCQFVQTAMLRTRTRTDDVCILAILPVSIGGPLRHGRLLRGRAGPTVPGPPVRRWLAPAARNPAVSPGTSPVPGRGSRRWCAVPILVHCRRSAVSCSLGHCAEL